MQKTRLGLALLLSVVLATGPSLSAEKIESLENILPRSNATNVSPHLIPDGDGKSSDADAEKSGDADAEKSSDAEAGKSSGAEAEKSSDAEAEKSSDADASSSGAEKSSDADASSSGAEKSSDADAEKPIAADVPSTNGHSNASHTPLMIDIDSAFLYTKGYENGEEYEIISTDNNTISKSNFQAGAKTFIIIHGFQSWATKPWILKLKDKMLEKDPGSNVISVQWTSQAGSNFSYAAYNETLPYIQPLGKSVARMVEALHIFKRLDYKDVHVVGLNLGAHIAGFAGKAKIPFGRITGLDPASKGFLGTSAAERLDKSDAYYVDIIHSNSCNNWNVWSDCFGIFQSIGHTDFWPNGGKYQPACKHKKSKGLRCDHTIVTDYFIESFAYSTSTTRFLARPAKNYEAYCHGNVSCGSFAQYMGIFASSSSLGDYFLNTSTYEPYALLDANCPSREHEKIITDGIIAVIVISVVVVVVLIVCFVLYKVTGIFKKKSDDATDPLLGDGDDHARRIVAGQEQPPRSSILGGVARGFADIINRPVDV